MILLILWVLGPDRRRWGPRQLAIFRCYFKALEQK
jgi:hypothetical protein